MTFEDKLKEAITDKAFDRCLGCVDEAIKKIKKAAEEEIENRIRKLGTEIVKCKCGQEMFWIKTKNGKPMPVCLDLISHFADCKFAKKFRKNN